MVVVIQLHLQVVFGMMKNILAGQVLDHQAALIPGLLMFALAALGNVMLIARVAL